MDTSPKRNTGKLMIDALRAAGRAKRKRAVMTTEQLAAAAGVPASQAYSRLYWLMTREGKLVSPGGKGAAKLWQLAPGAKRPRVRSYSAAEMVAAVES